MSWGQVAEFWSQPMYPLRLYSGANLCFQPIYPMYEDGASRVFWGPERMV